MAWGLYANVAVTTLAALAYAAACLAALRRQRRGGHPAGPVPWFHGLIALFLAAAAARQLVAEGEAQGLLPGGWGRWAYLAVVPLAAVVIVPHAYLVALVRTGRDRIAQAAAAAFLLLVALGLAFAFAGGATPEPRGDYGYDWTLDSAVARILVAVVILLPGLAGSAWLVALARRQPDASGRRRIRRIGWAALGYFVLFTIDAYGLSGPPFLAARILLAATGVLAWSAYRDREVTYVPPPDKPGENPYGR